MKKTSTFLVAALSLAMALPASAQYVTKGDKSVYTFDSLSKIAESGVTKDGNTYSITQDIEIAATDTLKMDDGAILKLGNDVVIKIIGYGDFTPATGGVITRLNADTTPKGVYFYTDESDGEVANIDFEYSSLRYGGATGITIENCSFTNVTTNMTSSGVIAFSSSNSDNKIINCRFIDCEATAVGGAANMTCGIIIKNCYFNDCNKLNSNKPMLNLTVGGDLPVIIEGNTIVGNKRTKVGGIGVSNMLSLAGTNKVYIRNNKVTDCRYGITTIGPQEVVVSGNTLINNCYETNAMNGGSAMSLYDPTGKQTVIVTGNYMEGSLWGITAIGCKEVNAGKTEDPAAADYNPGENIFVNNGNGGVLYDLYNNSTNTIYAQGNVWNVATLDAESIETVITHKVDNASLGEVIFMPAGTVKAAPHSLAADVIFNSVALSWKAPNETMTLQWHDGEDYNGVDGIQTDPEGPCSLIAGARFTADDLKNAVGCAVDSIAIFEYRDAMEVYLQIYENGALVREQKVNRPDFVKNAWRHVALDEPYFIPANTEVIFAERVIHGYNMTYTVTTDRSPANGKGNIVSFDGGKTWKAEAPGDFLITAMVRKSGSANPVGYNVYRDGEKVNAEAVTATAYTLTGEADGTHSYAVSAVYDTIEKLSAAVEATAVDAANVFPAVATIDGSVEEGLNGTVTWQAPLTRGTELTWSSTEKGIAIGGTSSTSPKVWVKNQFDENDLLAYPNHQITAINAYFADNTITGVTLFVIKNGTIEYSQVISADSVAMIPAEGGWFKFKMNEPYKLEQGNTYAFGCYYTHAKSAHPVGVDNTVAVEGKGNMFSISSPKSSGFNLTKPTWKSLSAGNIAGNFMLSADVEALGEVGEAPVVASYDVYRNGEKVASDLTATSYSETSSTLGTYTYSVVAKGTNGHASVAKSVDLTYTLPDSYVAPIVTASNFNEETKQFTMAWSNDAVELKHYGTPAYMAGFAEEMTMMYGSKFTAAELESMAGYKINSLKFALGATVPSFKLEIYAGTEQLYSEEFAGSDITAGALYTLTLDTPVTIPAGKDLYLVYNATIPANTSALILDGGPAIENGAVVSLTNGANWLKLGTIASDYADYNIVIGATALPGEALAAPAKAVELGRQLFTENARGIVADVEEYGIESTGAAAPAVAKAAAKTDESAAPKVTAYRVYCNNAMVAETTAANYAEVIKRYGEYAYSVANVYENGWESPASKKVYVDNFIAQKPQAPYGLTGTAEGADLNLAWEAVDADAAVMKYHTGDTDMALGMTGSGTREGYQIVKFTADSLATAGKVGEVISHIKFKLASTDIYTAAVVVMYGDNIVYEQPIALEDVVLGWNTVRLNNPVAIPEGVDVSFGYHLTYANGIKPLMMDGGPSVKPGFSDLISSSATSGYWYSLKNKYKQDYNWRIEAYFRKTGQTVEGVAAAPALNEATATTYNVYCDGTPVATAVSECAYKVTAAATGKYTVTAVIDGVESAESNVVEFFAAGIDGVSMAGKAFYDRNADRVVLPAAIDAQVFSASGVLVKNVSGVDAIDMSDIAAGSYIVKTATATVKVVK